MDKQSDVLPEQLSFSGKWGEIIGGVIVASFAVVMMIASLKLPAAYSPKDVGPSVFPLIASLATLVLSLALIIRAFVQSDKGCIRITRPRRVSIGLLLIVAYVALIPIMGTYSSTFLFVCAMIYTAGSRTAWVIVFNGVLALLMTYLLFALLLNVDFPSGVFL